MRKQEEGEEEEECCSSRIISRQRPRCCCSCTKQQRKKQKKRTRTTKGGDSWLPQDLQESVLARLAVLEVFRLRCVCKSWNRILRSPNFFALHSQLAPSETWSVMHTLGETWQAIVLFNPATRRWISPPPPRFQEPGYSWNLFEATGAGSFVCSPATHPHLGTDYFVLNIFTGAVRKLPRLPLHHPFCERDRALHMSLDSLDKSKSRYRVFLVQLASNQVAMYDSSTQVWKVGKPSSPFLRRPKLTVLHGQLFATPIASNCKQFHVYDIHQHQWTDAQLPWPSCPRLSRSSCLSDCGHGRTVLLVPHSTPAPAPASTCHGFAVWDLQQEPNPGNKKWVEVARTPTAPQFATPQGELLLTLFCSNRNFILMTATTDVTGTNFAKPVLYDVSLDRWESLPPLPPKLAAPPRSRYLSLMMLEPNLAATP